MSTTSCPVNGGTILTDHGGNCFQRLEPNWGPREFGAKGDGSDDHSALQNWLNANQPHIGDVGTYIISSPLNCKPNTTIQGPSNGSNGGGTGGTPTPLFQIVASSTFAGRVPGGSSQAVLGAQNFCRLSGVGIAGNQQAVPETGGVSSGSATITFTSSVSGFYIGNAVTGPDIQANTTVASPINTDCTPTPCVVISKAATGNNSSEPLMFWGPDALDVLGRRVTVDGFSALMNGYHNIDCGDDGSFGGLQLKNSEFLSSLSDNVYMPSGCSNARLVGDIVSTAGGSTNGTPGDPNARGVVFKDKDVTIADGVIEQSNGIGLDLEGAERVSVSGNFFDDNGKSNGGAAILVGNNVDTVSVCGNHVHRSGYNGGGTPGTSQILFSGAVNNVSFCGNVYQPATAADSEDMCGGMLEPPCWPQYVYDAAPGTTLTNASFYENPEPQVLGVLSPAAAGVLPQSQVTPANRSFLTGLVLSNQTPSSPSAVVTIASGSATDSTGITVISLAAGCTVNLASTTNGLGALDTGGASSPNTTYFFFAVADLSGQAPPNCMASASLSPSFANVLSYGTGVYRLLRALYTTATNNAVPFHQDGDTFYLASSVTDIQTGGSSICASFIGTAAVSCPLSVPCGRMAATCSDLSSPGFSVEAIGRIVGGSGASGTSQLLISSPNQSDQAPANFPTAPGFTNAATGAIISAAPPVYPFHLATDGSGDVRVRASASSVTAYEVTDGWIWRRQR